jgi:hypothetical protein
MTQDLPAKTPSNALTKEWEGISVKGENKEHFGGYTVQEVKKGMPGV